MNREDSQKIRQLLEPENEIYDETYYTNVDLAFQIMKGVGVPDDLQEYVFRVYTLHCLEYNLEEYRGVWKDLKEIIWITNYLLKR